MQNGSTTSLNYDVLTVCEGIVESAVGERGNCCNKQCKIQRELLEQNSVLGSLLGVSIISLEDGIREKVGIGHTHLHYALGTHGKTHGQGHE